MELGHEPVAHVCLSNREPGARHRYETVTRAQSCVLHICAVTQAARCVLSTGINSQTAFPFCFGVLVQRRKKKKQKKSLTGNCIQSPCVGSKQRLVNSKCNLTSLCKLWRHIAYLRIYSLIPAAIFPRREILVLHSGFPLNHRQVANLPSSAPS